jgi:hypothetical protein
VANKNTADTGRRWEDLASILMGITAAAAAVYYHPAIDIVVLNATAAGMAIVALAALDLLVPPHWEEPIEMAVGAWLAVSPFWLDYSGPLRIIHAVIGVLIVVLAAVELWQDRKNTEA